MFIPVLYLKVCVLAMAKYVFLIGKSKFCGKWESPPEAS